MPNPNGPTRAKNPLNDPLEDEECKLYVQVPQPTTNHTPLPLQVSPTKCAKAPR